MRLLSAVLDHDRVLYIMTLGVVQGHRHRGLASTLIAIACQQAYETRWVCSRNLAGLIRCSSIVVMLVCLQVVSLHCQCNSQQTSFQ
jgi:hypothetical protein